MRSILAFACIAALSAPALAAADLSLGTANGYGWIGAQRDVSPETLGQMFCTARISGDMTPLAKYFAPKLTTLLAEIPPSAAVPWQTFSDSSEELRRQHRQRLRRHCRCPSSS